MKVADIPFADAALREAVLGLNIDSAEDITELRARKQKIRDTSGLEHLPNLTLLDLTRNLISDINLSGNPQLEELYLGNNQLEELDLSYQTQLTHLEIFMNDIAELDLRSCPLLENLYAAANDLTHLKLLEQGHLSELKVSDNNLGAIELQASVLLTALEAEHNALSETAKRRLEERVSGHRLRL